MLPALYGRLIVQRAVIAELGNHHAAPASDPPAWLQIAVPSAPVKGHWFRSTVVAARKTRGVAEHCVGSVLQGGHERRSAGLEVGLVGINVGLCGFLCERLGG